MKLEPGWVDGIAAAVKAAGNETERAAALGERPRWRLRIDPARLAASAARGGHIGGKTRAERKRRGQP